ncbi:unnamed protein product [Lampetra planeri]
MQQQQMQQQKQQQIQQQRMQQQRMQQQKQQQIQKQQPKEQEQLGKGLLPQAAQLPIARDMAVTLHTDLGDLKLELFCEQAPRACENFLALCASDYYNGCIFHRNIKGFMVQTGDPTGTGKGGNSIWGRKFDDEFNEHLKHNVRGVVTMANSGPNTNSSQFFITYAKQPHLDMKYTIFGKVIDGLDTLDELEKISVHEKTFRPLTDVRLKSVRIHANPLAP